MESRDGRRSSLNGSSVGGELGIELSDGSVTEEDFKLQPGEVHERIHQRTDMTVEVGKERFSSQHQSFGQQITSDFLEKAQTSE